MKHSITNNILSVILGITIGIIISGFLYLGISKICEWENNQMDYENGFVEYEVVIWNDHDVILYNSNDVSDSIHMRLENSYNLVPEQIIQIHK